MTKSAPPPRKRVCPPINGEIWVPPQNPPPSINVFWTTPKFVLFLYRMPYSGICVSANFVCLNIYVSLTQNVLWCTCMSICELRVEKKQNNYLSLSEFESMNFLYIKTYFLYIKTYKTLNNEFCKFIIHM